jgi:hypothetical protein
MTDKYNFSMIYLFPCFNTHITAMGQPNLQLPIIDKFNVG